MTEIVPAALEQALEKFLHQSIYVHLEVNPGAYTRNHGMRLCATHVRGNHPYRVFLTFDDGVGVLHIDDVTHMDLSENLVIVTGYDEHDRIARTLELSRTPLSM